MRITPFFCSQNYQSAYQKLIPQGTLFLVYLLLKLIFATYIEYPPSITTLYRPEVSTFAIG